LQNHFLGNSLDEKKFGRKFFCCKIIFSETIWMKKILVENFLLQNDFLGNSLDEKNFGRIFFLQIHFLGNGLNDKILVENVFVAKSFPRKQFG